MPYLEDLFNLDDPETKAKILWLFYLISFGMMVLGFILIILFWNS
ncbi:MAG: hypothetical protein QW520_08345 [Methanomassiliicoccales archaeon]